MNECSRPTPDQQIFDYVVYAGMARSGSNVLFANPGIFMCLSLRDAVRGLTSNAFVGDLFAARHSGSAADPIPARLAQSLAHVRVAA